MDMGSEVQGVYYLSQADYSDSATITLADINTWQSTDHYVGINLDAREVWVLPDALYGIQNFTISSSMVASIGFGGDYYVPADPPGYINTGSGTDGIQLYGTDGGDDATSGIIFRSCVFQGSNSNAVFHNGGGARSCRFYDCTFINNTASTGVCEDQDGDEIGSITALCYDGSVSAFTDSGLLIVATSGLSAFVSYSGIDTETGTFLECEYVGGGPSSNTVTTGGAIIQVAYAFITDTQLEDENSEDLYSLNCQYISGSIALGLGIANQSGANDNDSLWENCNTFAGFSGGTVWGGCGIYAVAGANHTFINYYDRSQPTLATVYNHGAELSFIGGEDDNQSVYGVSHLLDDSDSATTLIERAVTPSTDSELVAIVSDGTLILKARSTFTTTAQITLSGGTLDLTEQSGEFGNLTITGSTGNLALAPTYVHAPPQNSFTGTTTYYPTLATPYTSTGTFNYTTPNDNTTHAYRITCQGAGGGGGGGGGNYATGATFRGGGGGGGGGGGDQSISVQTVGAGVTMSVTVGMGGTAGIGGAAGTPGGAGTGSGAGGSSSVSVSGLSTVTARGGAAGGGGGAATSAANGNGGGGGNLGGSNQGGGAGGTATGDGLGGVLGGGGGAPGGGSSNAGAGAAAPGGGAGGGGGNRGDSASSTPGSGAAGEIGVGGTAGLSSSGTAAAGTGAPGCGGGGGHGSIGGATAANGAIGGDGWVTIEIID
jgi:hypothetical protein